MTINKAVEKYNLDKRRKWFAWCGTVVRNEVITMPCSGCSCDCSDGHGCNHGNFGCFECGYTGKRRNSYPVAALDERSMPISTTSPDFKRFNK